MDVKTLCVRHPVCDVATFRRYNALYMGGRTFRDMVGEFLSKQPNDTPEMYQARLKEASYRSYVGQIVQKYAADLFASHYAIRTTRDGEHVELDPYYAALKEDCDGQGTDLTTFFKDRFRQSLVTRASYWCVEFPRKSPEDLGLTEDEWKAQGHDRARLRAIDASSVLDWEADDEGCFAWVKTYARSTRRPDPSSPTMIVDTWTIYYPDHVDVHQIEYEPKKKPKPTTIVPIVESYAHGCARVPILAMRLQDGMWLLDAVADAQVEHFRLSCALSWSLKRCAYPLAVLKMSPNGEKPVIGQGLGITIGTEESFGWAEPSGGSLSQLREEIKSQKDEIYRIAQQVGMSSDSTSSAVARSGLSKMADAEATSACLRDYATVAREAIEATFELISNARQDYDIAFSVEGLSTFNTQDIESIIDAATSAKEAGIEDESDTFRVESHYRIASLVLPSDTAQDTKDKIREEIRSGKQKDLGLVNGKPVSAPDASGNHNESRTNANEEQQLQRQGVRQNG